MAPTATVQELLNKASNPEEAAIRQIMDNSKGRLSYNSAKVIYANNKRQNG